MTARRVVHVIVLGLGTLAGPATAQQPAPPPLSPSDAAWRAVVVDGAKESLLMLDAAVREPVRVGPAVPGNVVELRDPSRLVFLQSGVQGATATIFSGTPPRTLGPVSLGDCLIPWAGAPAIAFRDRIVGDIPDRLILSCRSTVVSLDLERGTAATQPSTAPAALRPLGGSRVLAISTPWEDRPLRTDLAIYDARTLGVTARARVEGQLLEPVLVPGGTEIVAVGRPDEFAPDQPTRLRYFDPNTAAETRTVPLGDRRSTRLSADGRFAYATNMDRNKPKQTARELRVLRVDTGEVLETVRLQEHSSWFTSLSSVVDSSLPLMIEDRRFKEPALSRLLVLGEGRVRATLPMYGFVHQVSVDRERGRMYLLDKRCLTIYTWPELQLEKQVVIGKLLDWGGQPSDEPSMSLAPGATRGLVVSGSRAVVVDLVAGRAFPEVKLGSSGARARRFWGAVAVAPLVIASQGAMSPTDSSVLPRSPFDPVPVAFSTDGRMAMLPAPTGQITAVDMTTGSALRHVPGGEGAVAFGGVPLVIAADKQSSWVFNVATGDVVARVAVPAADADAPLSVSVSPDGRFLLIGRGAAVHLLEAATGRPVSAWTGFGRVTLVRFLRPVPTS